MENAEKYPEKVRDILYKDIFMRPDDDPVRLAYEVASEMHKGQKRKGLEELDYITHPLQVYDMVKKCIGDDKVPNKDVTLAASLLHDAVEDYKKENKDRQLVRKEAIGKIEDEFIRLITQGRLKNVQFAEQLVNTVTELTNPIKEMGKEEKRKYQVDKARTALANVKLIKICDQTLNIISNIEEVPPWDYHRLIEYTNKATAVVKSALKSIEDNEGADSAYSKAVKLAWRVYSDVSDEELRILKNMRSAGKPIPPEYHVATFSMEALVDHARSSGGKIHGFSR